LAAISDQMVRAKLSRLSIESPASSSVEVIVRRADLLPGVGRRAS
jgi:hypothetical protein